MMGIRRREGFMRGVYLYYTAVIDAENPSPIDLKVMAQIKSFEKAGLSCGLVTLEGGINTVLDKIRLRLPYSNLAPRWEYKDAFSGLDFIYIRQWGAFTVHMRRMLGAIKEKNPDTKLVLEIVTYPYDNEMTLKKRNYPLLWKDRYNRKRLKGLLDRIACIGGGNEKQIFGVDAIAMSNGVDLDAVRPRIAAPKKGGAADRIDLCAVAAFAPWHGYERVLHGLSDYYGREGEKRDIVLHMVGDGPECGSYRAIAGKCGLGGHVKFYGFKTGRELDDIFDGMDIGLDQFGVYKSRLEGTSSLKARTYLAKGLPVISGCNSDIIRDDGSFRYRLQFPNDSSPIDIGRVVDFYDSIYLGGESRDEVIGNIRKFAEDNCGMDKTMAEVIEYIKSGRR
jgi:glycosyltransferase involved in cell wall biosynthesis